MRAYEPLQKTGSARSGAALEVMLWVDSDQYYGPDRRRLREKRMRERRRYECGDRLPAMNTALVQLRMRTLEAHGDRLPAFIIRLKGVVTLANMKSETGVAHELIALIGQLTNLRGGDPRQIIYAALDRAQAHLN